MSSLIFKVFDGNFTLGRNFKAAKVVTEERKKIMEEGEKSQEAVEVLEAKQRQLKLSIDALDDEISRSKEKIFEIETEMGKHLSSHPCLLLPPIKPRDSKDCY